MIDYQPTIDEVPWLARARSGLKQSCAVDGELFFPAYSNQTRCSGHQNKSTTADRIHCRRCAGTFSRAHRSFFYCPMCRELRKKPGKGASV